MRSLTSTRCFLYKLSNVTNPISKSSLRNFKRTYTIGKPLLFKLFNAVRFRTKYLSQKLNFYIMNSQTTISITETAYEVECNNSPSTSDQRGRSTKEKEEETSRRYRHKESITSVSKSENRKPVSFTIKHKKSPNLVNVRDQKLDNKIKNLDAKAYRYNDTAGHKRSETLQRHYAGLRSNSVPVQNVMSGMISPYPDNSFFRFSNVFYHSLSDTQVYAHHHRSLAVEYSNSTRASQSDKQHAWALRTWQRTSLGKLMGKSKPSSGSCTFKIMSYNVLAQELLEEHGYLYQYHNPNAIVWKQRWFTLLNELKFHNADILCLQEVQASHVETYFNELHQLGYSSVFKKRTGYRTDGCAIYYKHSVFKLVEQITVEFNQSNIHVLNRDNVAIIAKFAPKNNEENEFVVATTHLLYNRKREDVRLAQTQVLLSEVDRIAYKPSSADDKYHVPVIITGDFNFSPESPVYQLLNTGVLKYDHLPNKTLSNQNTSFANATGKKLLPAFLRITDQCQHADLVEERLKNNSLERADELSFIRLNHSERQSARRSPKDLDHSLFSTGTITHHFNLKSAYMHGNHNDTEATTFQDKWITVDYIFYSTGLDENTGRKRDDKLKLLSRYTLPTTEKLRGLRIPNFALGSDHLLLLVMFQLDP